MSDEHPAETYLEELPTDGRPERAAFGGGRKVKETQSICPVCLDPVAADVRQRGQEIWLDKRCREHGLFSALLSSDARHYYLPAAELTDGAGCCAGSCGAPAASADPDGTAAPWANHSCTILIEITERCNLTCPTCFAGSSPQHANTMRMEEFTRQVDRLASGGKRGSDMIQLSGGEPTLHPDFLDMVDLLFDRGFHNVCINSNGIKLARPAFVRQLAERARRHPHGSLYVYLQFDGFEGGTHAALRGREDLLETKQRAMENCERHDISVHPVMTLTRGINDHEVGDFIRLAIDRPSLSNIVIQPAMYSGRYDNPRRQDRITLADTVGLVCDQTGVFAPEDFRPIPCSDPNCFGMAMALRTPRGLLPISRFFPAYENWTDDGARELIERFSDTIDGPRAAGEAVQWITSAERAEKLLESLDESEIDDLLGVLIDAQSSGAPLWDRVVTVSIKPFMDAWTYDQDRIDQCCVHILDREGNPVSFCEYNAINRPRMAASESAATAGTLPLKVMDA